MRADRVALAGDQLGGHVVGRAHHGPGVGQAALAFDRGQAEVGHAHAPLGVDQHVLGLDVAVHDPALVRVGQRARHVAHQLHLAALVELARDLAQGAGPLHQLVDDERRLLQHAHRVHAQDPRVLERGRDLALAAEALQARGPARGGDHLQGHLALQLGVPGQVDHPHAALAQHAAQLEAPLAPQLLLAVHPRGRGAGRPTAAQGRGRGRVGGQPALGQRRVQRRGQRLAVAQPLRGGDRQRPLAHRLQGGGHRGAQGAGRGRAAGLHQAPQLEPARGREGVPPADRLVEHHPQRPHVGRGPHAARHLGVGLLGGHVERGAHHGAAAGQAVDALDQGQAEVRHAGSALRVDQHVARGQVAVHHPPRVREPHRARHVAQQAHPPREAQRGQRLEQVRGPRDQLVGQEGDPAHLAAVEERHQPLVAQRGGQLALAPEAGLLLGSHRAAQDLERHLALRAPGPVDPAGAALAQGGEHDVGSEGRPGEELLARGRGRGAFGDAARKGPDGHGPGR